MKKKKAVKLTPQQVEFLAYYFDPKSKTYANALQSAIKAGFSEEYAQNITHLMPDWLSESIGKHSRMLMKAERRLESLVDSDDERVSADVSKFVASTVGKKIYSTRQEQVVEDRNRDKELELLEKILDKK